MVEAFLNGKVTLHGGDNRDVLKSLADCSIDSIVTDPPYALVSIVKRFGKAGSAPAKGNEAYQRASAGFMGKQWDTGETAFATEFWAECLRVLKPGGHVVAFSGTRTYHRMACAIEDAGFEIRDQLGYLYGSGFPKSHNISRAIKVCTCQTISERRVRSVRHSDVSTTKYTCDELGEVLLSGLSQQGASSAGRPESADYARREQSGMERRGDLPETPRQLCEREVRSLSQAPSLNGQGRRLCDGASTSDGGMDRSTAHPNGMRSSQGSYAAKQSEVEPRALAEQSEPQARGAWEDCGRCGKPLVPDGLGTALKPAWEPICFGRKPIKGTIAENVLAHGTGAINVDGCRVGDEERYNPAAAGNQRQGVAQNANILSGTDPNAEWRSAIGRWPANIIHDGSEEVVSAFPETSSGDFSGNRSSDKFRSTYGTFKGTSEAETPWVGDSGSAARFFYTAKADAADRIGSKHPTVKPVDLMQWLVRLVTPKGGVVLDPFAGTGTTGEAAFREGMRCILVEREIEYQADIRRRMALCMAGPEERARESIKAKLGDKPIDAGPLFGGLDAPPPHGRRIYGVFADEQSDRSD